MRAPTFCPQGLRDGAFRQLLRRVRASLRGRPIARVQHTCAIERHGTTYGGWNIVASSLLPSSVVYAFGVGDDVSFDLSLIDRYQLTVDAFDPTPRAVSWCKQQVFPPTFIFHDYGVAPVDGELVFFPPADSTHVSFSMTRQADSSGASVTAPVKRLSTIMRELGHRHIDVLKLDIEGAEYDVLRNMIDDGIFPTQVLVEFHHRFFPDGKIKTTDTIRLLNDSGYRVVSVAPSGEEFSFFRVLDAGASRGNPTE